MKRCSKCKIEKDDSEFHKRKAGLQYVCKSCMSEKNRQYHAKNKDKVDHTEYYKQYYIKNKDTINEKNRRYHANNADNIRDKHTIYMKNRRTMDTQFRCMINYRRRLYTFYKSSGIRKSKRSSEMVGCTWVELRLYLTATYVRRYKTLEGIQDGHIDHLIPLCTATCEDDIIKLCHYTNLQLLTPEDNLSKGSKLDWVGIYMGIDTMPERKAVSLLDKPV